jgi:predicted negative regulator of RcsB-dependent stress response
MEGFESENQQLEVLKQFWQKYNRIILLAAIVFLIVLFGGRYWQKNKVVRSQQAAQIYQEMLIAEYQGDFITATAKGGQLVADFTSTPYSQLAGLMLAKIAVSENNLDLAVEKLQWVIKHKGSKKVAANIATVRLARVLEQQGKLDEALALVAKDPDAAYIPLYAQARGDILVAKGEPALAKTAYLLALQSLPPGAQAPSLQAKLLDLGGEDNA